MWFTISLLGSRVSTAISQVTITEVTKPDGMSIAWRTAATTINENGSRWQYAVPRRVVQRSSGLTGARKPADEFDPGRALAQRTVASW